MLYLRSEDDASGQWRATNVIRPPGIYLDLAVGRDRRVAIAYIDAGGATEPRANVLFVVKSSDGGNSWSRPIEISTPAEDPAYEPHVFFDPDEALRLVWAQQPLGEMAGGMVWHTVLTDTGRRVAKSLALPSNVITSHSQAAIDACGTIHLVRQWYGTGESELRYARVTEEGWSAWSPPFDIQGGHTSLAADDGMVHLLWSTTSRSPVDTTVFRDGLAYSTLPFSPMERRRRQH
jgi:hypothetical protein